MKKILPLAIISLFTFPMASIAADRAPDATINSAISMIEPGFCKNVFVSTQTQEANDWYKKSGKIISDCYDKELKSTNNNAYEKCLIGDLLIIKTRETLDRVTQEKKEKPIIDAQYFSDQAFLDRFNNLTKNMNSQKMQDYHDYLAHTFEVAQTKMNQICFKYIKDNN